MRLLLAKFPFSLNSGFLRVEVHSFTHHPNLPANKGLGKDKIFLDAILCNEVAHGVEVTFVFVGIKLSYDSTARLTMVVGSTTRSIIFACMDELIVGVRGGAGWRRESW